MPLRLTLLERVLARLNILPVPLFDTPLHPGIARALLTACELGLFDLLAVRERSLSELAELLACHPQGLQLLLQLLVPAGYLSQRRGNYRNTPLTQRWLVTASPYNIVPYIIHSPDIIAIWDHLPEVIQANAQVMRMPYDADATVAAVREQLARHYAGLAALATALGSDIIRHITLPADRETRLLDVGGSHAGYSVLLCQRYPRLHATILDIPPGLEAGQRTAKHFHLEHRMSFIAGDIVRDDFGVLFDEPFDVAFYFHIAHLLSADVNQDMLARVVRQLKPGGQLIFVDQVTDQTHGSRLASLMVQLMALTMTTVGGTCYPFATVKDWLTQAGLVQVRRHRLLTPGVTLITAQKPA